ncbi:nucleotide exchange factor GrpE [Algicella marina]|uniref:Protein GrpE n=1 Tax=Algicella marina TaxID=2683284 RepID=A0A6P1T1J2_9RHOB|nr:nucleotide exchange factor GrpE [Algicella marina]QHQ36608.1 nucleotide exchange factor GrpE [Algicella marina]
MGEPEENEFLDDPESLLEEEYHDDPSDEEIEVDSLRAERDELKDRLLRALAETENLRKRAERDRRDAELYGGVRLARDLLSVHDNLGRALETIDDTLRTEHAALVEGLELTQRDLVAVFNKHKIEEISPEIGSKFDPKLHQAMFEAPIPDQPSGSIIQVMAKGFGIGDRLLRPAQVGVSSGGGQAAKSEPATDEPEE